MKHIRREYQISEFATKPRAATAIMSWVGWLAFISIALLGAISVVNSIVKTDFMRNDNPVLSKSEREIVICDKLSSELGTTSEYALVFIDDKLAATFALNMMNQLDTKLIKLSNGAHTYKVFVQATMKQKLYKAVGSGSLSQTGELFMPYWIGSNAMLQKVDSCI